MKLLTSLILFLFFSFNQEKVLICKSGGAYAYHKSICRGLKECSHTIERVSQSEAVRLGRKPCHNCYAVTAVMPIRSSQESTSGQCKATTQKGSRCSRNARSGGYCWQHGG